LQYSEFFKRNFLRGCPVLYRMYIGTVILAFHNTVGSCKKKYNPKNPAPFKGCPSVRFSIARIVMICTRVGKFEVKIKKFEQIFTGSFRAAKFLTRMLSLILRTKLFQFGHAKNSLGSFRNHF
jgi:hypothetical protein